MPLASYAPPRRKRSDLERRRASSCLRRAARATRHFPPPAVSSGSRPPSPPKPRMEGRGAASASAPGKVLERPNAGLVLITTARFYAVVLPPRDQLTHDESWAWAWTNVKVTSPQLSREATYKLSPKKSTSSRESANPFVEQDSAILVTVADKEGKDALDKLCFCKVATIFYSYREQIEARGLPLTPDQKYCFRCLHSVQLHLIQKLLMELWNNDWSKPEVAKTGLGSSAAMTTSIVAALLHYLGAVSLLCLGELSSDSAAARDLDLLHAVLMQFPH
uniref:phosphomevalonate kinase n=1 Tax=Oryza rufipogon TaxID=4529 RepID=A0A0E0NZR3_ORYRU